MTAGIRLVRRSAVAAPGGLVADSIGWDVENWSRCLPFWERHSSLALDAKLALEVGASGDHGNLSLWLAAHGFRVVCSGIVEPSRRMRELHDRYEVADAITYEQIDVLDIPYRRAFDVVVFKSLLGAFGMDGGDAPARQRAAVESIRRSLRPGGELWFAENVRGSRLHALLRDRFGCGARGWTYPTTSDIDRLMSCFDGLDRTTLGVLGALGRSERQRQLLGRLDQAFDDRLARADWHYIVAGVARRGRTAEPPPVMP